MLITELEQSQAIQLVEMIDTLTNNNNRLEILRDDCGLYEITINDELIIHAKTAKQALGL